MGLRLRLCSRLFIFGLFAAAFALYSEDNDLGGCCDVCVGPIDTAGCLPDLFNQLLSSDLLFEAGPAPYAPRNGFCGNSIDFRLRNEAVAAAAAAAVDGVAAVVGVGVPLLPLLPVLLVRLAGSDWFCDDAAVAAVLDEAKEEVECTLRFDRVRQPDDNSEGWASEEWPVEEELERRLACDGTIKNGRDRSLPVLLPSPPLAASSLLVPLATGSVCVSRGCCRCPLLPLPLPTLFPPPPSLSSVWGLLSCRLFADLRRVLMLLLLLPGAATPGCTAVLTAAAAAAAMAPAGAVFVPVPEGLAEDWDVDADVAGIPESGIFATASTTLNPLKALCAKHATDVGRSDGDISSICDSSSIPAFVMFLHFLNESANDDVFGMSFGNLTPLYRGFTKNALRKFSGNGPRIF